MNEKKLKKWDKVVEWAHMLCLSVYRDGDAYRLNIDCGEVSKSYFVHNNNLRYNYGGNLNEWKIAMIKWFLGLNFYDPCAISCFCHEVTAKASPETCGVQILDFKVEEKKYHHPFLEAGLNSVQLSKCMIKSRVKYSATYKRVKTHNK